jgi:hypothetical protein
LIRNKSLFKNFIIERLAISYWSIHFDHQPGFGAIEVDDEAFQGMLAAEFIPTKPLVAELLPECVFFRSWFVPHLPRQRLELFPKFW